MKQKPTAKKAYTIHNETIFNFFCILSHWSWLQMSDLNLYFKPPYERCIKQTLQDLAAQ